MRNLKFKLVFSFLLPLKFVDLSSSQIKLLDDLFLCINICTFLLIPLIRFDQLLHKLLSFLCLHCLFLNLRFELLLHLLELDAGGETLVDVHVLFVVKFFFVGFDPGFKVFYDSP